MSSLGGDPSDYSPKFKLAEYYVVQASTGKIVAACDWPAECDRWIERSCGGGTYTIVRKVNHVQQKIHHTIRLEKF